MNTSPNIYSGMDDHVSHAERESTYISFLLNQKQNKNDMQVFKFHRLLHWTKLLVLKQIPGAEYKLHQTAQGNRECVAY